MSKLGLWFKDMPDITDDITRLVAHSNIPWLKVAIPDRWGIPPSAIFRMQTIVASFPLRDDIEYVKQGKWGAIEYFNAYKRRYQALAAMDIRDFTGPSGGSAPLDEDNDTAASFWLEWSQLVVALDCHPWIFSTSIGGLDILSGKYDEAIAFAVKHDGGVEIPAADLFSPKYYYLVERVGNRPSILASETDPKRKWRQLLEYDDKLAEEESIAAIIVDAGDDRIVSQVVKRHAFPSSIETIIVNKIRGKTLSLHEDKLLSYGRTIGLAPISEEIIVGPYFAQAFMCLQKPSERFVLYYSPDGSHVVKKIKLRS